MRHEEQILARAGRRFTTPAENVFDAWLDPQMIARWMFGPAVRDEEVIRVTIDACVGGAFSFVVRRQGKDIDHFGEYLEIARPRRLAFTWGVDVSSGSSRVYVDLVPQPPGCELGLIHELDPSCAEYLSRTEAAWALMLSTLANTLDEEAVKVSADFGCGA